MREEKKEEQEIANLLATMCSHAPDARVTPAVLCQPPPYQAAWMLGLLLTLPRTKLILLSANISETMQGPSPVYVPIQRCHTSMVHVDIEGRADGISAYWALAATKEMLPPPRLLHVGPPYSIKALPPTESIHKLEPRVYVAASRESTKPGTLVGAEDGAEVGLGVGALGRYEGVGEEGTAEGSTKTA